MQKVFRDVRFPDELDPVFETMSYYDRPDVLYVHEWVSGSAVHVNTLRIDVKTSRVLWAEDWVHVHELIAAGVLREKCYGPATYNHVDVFVA